MRQQAARPSVAAARPWHGEQHATRRPPLTLSPAITRARRCTAAETAACAARARLPLLPAPAAAQLQRPPFLTNVRTDCLAGRAVEGQGELQEELCIQHHAHCSVGCDHSCQEETASGLEQYCSIATRHACS